MRELVCINLSASRFEDSPFPHLYCASVLTGGIENQLYKWFESTNEWNLTEAEFYTQYEFVMTTVNLPTVLDCLISNSTVEAIKTHFTNAFDTKWLETVSIVAHKLVDRHVIGIHNDYINGEETHRLVIQINPHWNSTKGGLLMLFNSPRAEDVSKVIQPINNSAFGFEISDKSYHAVSIVRNFSRYSLVYTFKRH